MIENLSREQIIVGVIIIIVIVVIFIAVKSLMLTPPPPPEETEKNKEPVYEVEIGNVKFSLKEVKDRGNILLASESKFGYPQDLTTTERFIEVTIQAQNIGTDDIKEGWWNIGDLVDSEGRRFHYERKFDRWIPEGSECGAVLKPGFAPKSCTKIYEVAKISSGLKVTVSLRQKRPRYIDLGI
ncbi:hypothetical protein J7K03_00020 [bacterium]|nr:hypothetical protein [bacterium]